MEEQRNMYAALSFQTRETYHLKINTIQVQGGEILFELHEHKQKTF